MQRIWQDVAKRKGERAAEKALGEIEAAFFRLRQHPAMGLAGTRRGRALRRVIAGEYWIYYAETGSSVRIRHSTVRPGNALGCDEGCVIGWRDLGFHEGWVAGVLCEPANGDWRRRMSPSCGGRMSADSGSCCVGSGRRMGWEAV